MALLTTTFPNPKGLDDCVPSTIAGTDIQPGWASVPAQGFLVAPDTTPTAWPGSTLQRHQRLLSTTLALLGPVVKPGHGRFRSYLVRWDDTTPAEAPTPSTSYSPALGPIGTFLVARTSEASNQCDRLMLYFCFDRDILTLEELKNIFQYTVVRFFSTVHSIWSNIDRQGEDGPITIGRLVRDLVRSHPYLRKVHPDDILGIHHLC